MSSGNFKKWLYSFIICILSLSCSSDFEPHIMAVPTPVIYGIINPEDSLYQVRLTRSFIGPGSAYSYAQDPDSIYYTDAHVYFESRNLKGQIIDRVELLPEEIIPRDQGIFVREPNIVYQTDFESIRLRQELLANDGVPFDIDLFVIAEIPGQPDLTKSYTRLKEKPRILNPRGNIQKVYFYGEVPFYMEWSHSDTDVYFEIKVVMRFKEVLDDGDREAEIFWVLKGIEPNEVSFPGGSRTIYSYHFRPENFYSQVRAAIQMDPVVKGRMIQSLDFIILTSDGAVKNYNEIEEIVDDYHGASYTNVTNGLGLFSSYNTKGVYNQKLGQRELDSLALGVYTRHLNFSRW